MMDLSRHTLSDGLARSVWHQSNHCLDKHFQSLARSVLDKEFNLFFFFKGPGAPRDLPSSPPPPSPDPAAPTPAGPVVLFVSTAALGEHCATPGGRLITAPQKALGKGKNQNVLSVLKSSGETRLD